MTLRDGYLQCYFSSTEYNRINRQADVSYISPINGKERYNGK